MKAIMLKIYVEDLATGEMKPWTKQQLQVKALHIDQARQKALALLAERGLPTVRSINVAPDGALVIYCGDPPQRAEKPAGQMHINPRRPAPLKPKK
jgi:hypothetical protein